MNDKRILSIVLLLVCVQLGRQPLSDHANNLDFAIESKIDALLSKMTLEEKAGQMSQVSKFGEDGPGDIESEVRKGNIGSFLNIAEVGLRNKLQKTITFDLPTSELNFYDINMEYTVEPGDFKVWIGPNSTGGLLKEALSYYRVRIPNICVCIQPSRKSGYGKSSHTG